jgi:predicted lysophospholipase L1 biosynthesis ABC-type transport system permease subunit
MEERRRTVAVLRACGAGGNAVRRLLLGAVLALVMPAAAIGIVVQRLVLGPELGHLAASYATLDLAPSVLDILLTFGGLALAGAAAIVWVARSATREPVVLGLGG